ncbi:hypothetical protein HF086_007463 [Spodoptera exigua]|uniref:Uncharacterized protein n=1 Tax=Spodoptera exigua TaxID=7107 RepID=A0A922SM57_SPOEX|nr:hypothetical protein HF086_007463 [Spodoptera exigua]
MPLNVARVSKRYKFDWKVIGSATLILARLKRTRNERRETDEQREERRAAARQRYHELLGDASTHLSQEPDSIQEIRELGRKQDRLRRNVNQLSTSDEESTVYDIEEQLWLNKEGSGFMYNVAINYAANGNIGALEEVCAHCQARKWKGEPNGMCCASETRRGECNTAHQSRLDTMRTQNALSRSQESAEAHEMRLSIDRERHAKSRASETFTQREARLSSQRNHTDVARSCESVEGRQARLESDRERHESRASETYTQLETRLSSQRSRTDAARCCESVEALQI